MGTRLVYNARNLGNRHGRIKFGHVQENNEIASVQLLNGKDAGRHYMTMHQTGDKDSGQRGATENVCPGSFTIDFSTIPRRKRKKTRRRRIKSQAGEILDGGMKYTLLYTNEAAETGSEQFTTTPYYAYRKNRRRIKAKQATTIPEMDQNNITPGQFSESIQMVTGSTEYGVDENFFILSGSVFPASGSSATYKKTPEPIPFARISKRPNYNNSFFARLFFGNSIFTFKFLTSSTVFCPIQNVYVE